jgi:hypothetical protein
VGCHNGAYYARPDSRLHIKQSEIRPTLRLRATACLFFPWGFNTPPLALYFLKSQKLWEGNMAEGKSFDMKEEFGGLDFHSSRLEKRFISTMETIFEQPDKSIWEASEDRAEAKAIYRMLGNESFDRGEVLRAHREAMIGRMAEYGGTILAVRDTTGVKLQHPLEDRGDRVYQRQNARG